MHLRASFLLLLVSMALIGCGQADGNSTGGSSNASTGSSGSPQTTGTPSGGAVAGSSTSRGATTGALSGASTSGNTETSGSLVGSTGSTGAAPIGSDASSIGSSGFGTGDSADAGEGGTAGVGSGTTGASGSHTDTSGRGSGTGSTGSSAGTSGATSGSPAPDSAAANAAFSQCRFHFGTIDSIAKSGGSSLIAQLDYFTPGWMGQSDTFDMSAVCTESKSGGALANQVPVIVAYVAAFYAKRHFGLKDCNVGTPSLCQTGAADIQQNLPAIVNVYKSYASGFASCYGTSKPIIFEMEPDWYQYTISSQSQPMSPALAGSIMGQFVSAVKASLPNALFSIDVSPWVAPNNGSDNGKSWYSNFDMSQFTFVNTSGGGTNAGTALIRSSNSMTWAGLHQVTGKAILADTGYGANGVSAGLDPNWDVAANINARMGDGVVSISQYNPGNGWGGIISGLRGQLNKPAGCP